MEYFVNNSDPLIPISEIEFEDKGIYVTDDGMRVQYDEVKNILNVVQYSELNLGESIKDLTTEGPNSGIKLFWRLMNKKPMLKV